MADDLAVTELPDLALASILARPAARLPDLPLPDAAGCAGDAALTLIGVGPGTWLAVSASAEAHGTDALQEMVRGMADVVEQSGGQIVFRLAGAGARALLQRGAFIDLDISAFGPGAAAATVIARIDAVIWQLDDAAVFHIAVSRSYAESFRRWLAYARVGLPG